MIISYRSSRKLMQHPHQKSTIINVWVYFKISVTIPLIYRPVHRYSTLLIIVNFVVSYKISKSKSSKFGSFFQDYFSCSGSLEYFTLYGFSPLKFTETVVCPNTLPVLKNVERTIETVYSNVICQRASQFTFSFTSTLYFLMQT